MGNARIASIPQQTKSSVREFATKFLNTASELHVNEVAQAVEATFGIERRIWQSWNSYENSDPSTVSRSRGRFSISLIAGGGIITPLTPIDSREVFSIDKKISPEVFSRFKLPDTTKFIAFVQPDRDRFFRHYFAGLRFKTFYFNSGGGDISKYPGTLDITFGQNESITGGRLRGGILRVEGFFPLPVDKVRFLSLFGTGLVKLSRTNVSDPLILTAAPADTPIPGPDTVIITIPPINRDSYRIGVGVNLNLLIQNILNLTNR